MTLTDLREVKWPLGATPYSLNNPGSSIIFTKNTISHSQLSDHFHTPAVAAQRVLVLRLPVDAQLPGRLLAAVAHVELVVHVGESVVDESVVQLEAAVGSLAPDLVLEIAILDQFNCDL